jgi:hypothetical protein
VSECGKHKKLGCFLWDEDVREKIDTYLRENKFEVRIHTLTKYINEEVLLDLDDGLSVKLSKRIVIRCMKIFGYSYRKATKGVYMDGMDETMLLLTMDNSSQKWLSTKSRCQRSSMIVRTSSGPTCKMGRNR